VPFGQEGLVVTWTVPVPNQARVTLTNADPFTAAAKINGPEIPEDFPKKYTEKLVKAELFNATMTWDSPGLVSWEKRFGIEMEKGPLAVFEQYLKRDHAVLGTLVSHPRVANPELWKACSVVLQRAVIVFDPPAIGAANETAKRELPRHGKETLFLRSYFHSARDANTHVNFVPAGGIEMSFASDNIWYPLELTQFIEEPVSYVVLDILTPQALDTGRIPQPFKADKTGKVNHQGRSYSATRVTAKLEAKKKWPDLSLNVSTSGKGP
jgi:hypothetical protein